MASAKHFLNQSGYKITLLYNLRGGCLTPSYEESSRVLGWAGRVAGSDPGHQVTAIHGASREFGESDGTCCGFCSIDFLGALRFAFLQYFSTSTLAVFKPSFGWIQNHSLLNFTPFLRDLP